MESEEEMIQRLIKEGLTNTETEEEKIERLVQEELKNENKTLRCWDMTTEEWEEIKGKALSDWFIKANPIISYSASIVICSLILYIISLFLSMMGLSVVNFILLNPFVIIGLGLFAAYSTTSQIKTIWKSPESYYKFSQGKKPGQKLS